ncbi:GNAT family N-acetyltransferase [Pseudodesulfovibrio nedwellii]|nr:GNAT family N-acetyltransferase [Pseudodesulfovibrio nedwellii]
MSDDIKLRFDTTGVDWAVAANVLKRAPLSIREPDKIQATFENSNLVCFAWFNNELVGMARALSDGVYQSVIYDLCILPEHQGKHLGSRIMKALTKRLNTPSVVLWSVPGKEKFYARLGFNPMLTAMALVKDPDYEGLPVLGLGIMRFFGFFQVQPCRAIARHG